MKYFSASIALVPRYFKSNRLFPFEWVFPSFSKHIFYFRRNISFHRRDIIIPSSFWLTTHLRNLSFTKSRVFFPSTSSIEFDTSKDSDRNQTVEKFMAHLSYSEFFSADTKSTFETELYQLLCIRMIYCPCWKFFFAICNRWKLKFIILK